METKIDIAAILKDKPKNIKLYSPIFGDVYFLGVEDNIIKVTHRGKLVIFFGDGRYYNYPESEPLLFPSKEMHDWSKFAWKKGDVLVSNDGGTEVIFNKWYDDTYTNFYSKHYLNSEDENNIKYNEAFLCTTERYYLEDKDTAQTYINTIEKRLGGKLNLETLVVEKVQPEFKDGDIVALVVRKCTHIAIFQSRQETYIGFHAVLCQNDELLLEEPFREDDGDIELRPATDSEKQQLFDALAKEGKRWNPETKTLDDLPKKCEFKTFDKVLVRNSKDDTWEADFFARLTRKEIDYTQSGKYLCVGDLWMYCIPYNEETAHLLGTTDEWKGGEG